MYMFRCQWRAEVLRNGGPQTARIILYRVFQKKLDPTLKSCRFIAIGFLPKRFSGKENVNLIFFIFLLEVKSFFRKHTHKIRLYYYILFEYVWLLK